MESRRVGPGSKITPPDPASKFYRIEYDDTKFSIGRVRCLVLKEKTMENIS